MKRPFSPAQTRLLTMTLMSRLRWRAVMMSIATTVALTACAPKTEDAQVVPVEITASTSSVIDGMLLADFPGPKAQIHYANQTEPEFVCNTADLFYIHLAPEQLRKVRAIFVQDMAKADWDAPVGHWIDATQAWYVAGSKRHGSMGPTLASFASETDAQTFARQYGGQVVAYSGVTLELVMPADDGLSSHSH